MSQKQINIGIGDKRDIQEWRTNLTYDVNEEVSINTTVYICLVCHHSGDFATDLAANYWAAVGGTGGGGGETLAETLVLGNVTGGTNVVYTGTDKSVYTGAGQIYADSTRLLLENLTGNAKIRLDSANNRIGFGSWFDPSYQIYMNLTSGSNAELYINNFNNSVTSRLTALRADISATDIVIHGSDSIAYALRVNSLNAANVSTERFRIGNGANIETAYFTTNTDVAIGKTTTGAHLDIQGRDALNASYNLRTTSNTGFVGLQVRNSGRVGVGFSAVPLAVFEVQGGVVNAPALKVTPPTIGTTPTGIRGVNDRVNGIAARFSTDETTGRAGSKALFVTSRGVGLPLDIQTSNSGQSVDVMFRMTAVRTGIAVSQLGGKFTGRSENDAGNFPTIMEQAYQFTDDTDTAENASWTLNLADAGSLTEKAYIDEATIRFGNLSGAGTQMVTADASGNLGRQAIPSSPEITDDRIPRGTGTTIEDGTWTMVGNDIAPVTDGSNIGTATEGIGTLYMASAIDYRSNLEFITSSTTVMTIGTNESVGIGVSPSADYRFQVDVANGDTQEYAIRGRTFQTTGNGAAIYGQKNSISTSGQYISGLFENVGASTGTAVNVAGWFDAQNAAGALNNRSLVASPSAIGHIIFGRTAAIASNVLHSVFGLDATSSNYAMRIYRSNLSPMFSARNDGWIGIGNISAPTTAGTVMDVNGGLRVISGLFMGGTGPSGNHIKAPAGYTLRFGASQIRENGGWWEHLTASGNYRFRNSGNNHTLLELQGAGANTYARWGTVTATGGTTNPEYNHEFLLSFWDGGAAGTTTNRINATTLNAAGDSRFEFELGGSDKVFINSAGSNLVANAGDIETTGSTNGLIVEDRTNGNRYRIYTDGGVLNTELVP